MATLATKQFAKTPTEEKILGFEVPLADLITGETISTADITSTPSGITWGSEAISGRFVEAKATGGTLGIDYHVTLAVVTSGGQKLEYCGTLLVRACA